MEGNRKNTRRYALLLVLAAFIWGTAFVAQSMGMDYIGPCTFNATRSFIGSVALLPVIWFFSRRQGRGARKSGEKKKFWLLDKALLIGGAACGVMLSGGSLLQQMGLTSTFAGKAGFLTSLYIVIVPVLGVFLGKRAGFKVWIGVVLALAGAYLLSGAATGEGFSIAPGDLLVLISALFFSLHILVIDHFSPRVDGIMLSCVQFFVAGAVSLVFALIFEKPALGDLLPAWGPLLYTGVLSSGVAYTLQIVGQQNVPPTVASLLMSLESVFAAVSGWMVLGQPLSLRELMGCALVFGAVVLAQLPDKKTAKEAET
ncbi:DMT family transporter [Neglecta sp. X4]|uniref:DMT family transporter n=1 Tax=unclassified Neglectibacter TaxID=2632164 RepID=UPI00136A3C79|nr:MULTISPECIES: DMT family transporter [unclassified Neglectibacter]NBI16416.1 DMT family transporter [Neglectibacter sp. 59]NBJ72114.1 DMT family transporter [Neglectibacter sp. X4]NCE79890.1 DMT family transporter [Neglectibacter sp. X58]